MSFIKKSTAAFVALSAVMLTVSVSQAATSADSIRVNCGGGAFTDSAGKNWIADSGFTGGQTYSATSEIANTQDDALHQDERWDSQDFSYNFNVTPGTYTVSLYEASLYAAVCNAGGRVFDVTINGTKVLTNYDMFNEVGCLTAQIKPFTVSTTSNGKINITFNVGSAGNPKINAISVLYLNSTVTGIHGTLNQSKSNLSVASSKSGISIQTQTQGLYTLELSTVRGERIGKKSGFGSGMQSFTNLRPGLYLLTSRINGQTVSRTVSVLP